MNWKYSREALLNGLPVDDIPDGREVLDLAVLVLEAMMWSVLADSCMEWGFLLVGVLPSVNAEQRLELTDNRVLVL